MSSWWWRICRSLVFKNIKCFSRVNGSHHFQCTLTLRYERYKSSFYWCLFFELSTGTQASENVSISYKLFRVWFILSLFFYFIFKKRKIQKTNKQKMYACRVKVWPCFKYNIIIPTREHSFNAIQAKKTEKDHGKCYPIDSTWKA